MAETKEGYLNQSYYGPTIPPQQPTARPIPSSMRAKLQDCTPYSLICMAFKMTTTVIIVLGTIVLVLWLVYQPSALKVYVENASLTRFDLLPNSTLHFNFTATLSVRNPNEKVGIYYKHVQATAFYSDAKLGDIVLPLFHQPKKNTTVFDLSYAGPPVVVGEAVNATYARERGEGWFWLSLKFYTKVRLRMIVISSVEYTPEGDCSLRLPAPANATSAAAGFERTGCHVDEFT